MIWRLVITTILLGSAAAIQLNTAATAQPGPLYVLIAWTYALSAGYALSLRLTGRAPWLVDVQLALDALTVAGFVWVTGGILSYFSFIYVLPIMAASAVHFRRGALRVTALSMAALRGHRGAAVQPGAVPALVGLGPRCGRCSCPAASWPSTRWRSTCWASSLSACSPGLSPSACGRPTRNWPTRRRPSPTSRRTASTSSTA